MKVFKTIEPISKLILKTAAVLNSFGLEIKDFGKTEHPQEDYLAVSKRHPIFAVADGVTLELNKDGTYPSFSGSGEVAKIFCETIVKETDKIYSNFTVSSIKKIFARANTAAGKFNNEHGRARKKLNYWNIDLFAATTAFAVVKDRVVYWASLCDSYVAHFDNLGQLKFKSPDPWPSFRENLPKDWAKIPEVKRKKIIRRMYRNGVNKKGELIGYGVVTGEKSAERYLNFGQFEVKNGDVVFILTDGFENYINLPEFIQLFNKWPRDLDRRVKSFVAKKSIRNPRDYGHEKTIIAIKFLFFIVNECCPIGHGLLTMFNWI